MGQGARDYPWRQWARFQSWLEMGQVAVVDGANGTEIQRRGGRPAETFSSGTAPLARPDLCQEVHEAYLDCGADIIITNSYSANRNVMTPSGNGGRAQECILAAAAIARRAALSHVSAYAAKLAANAAAQAAVTSQQVSAAATAAARSTTSLATGVGAELAAVGARDAATLGSDVAVNLQRAVAEVHACAAAAKAAGTAAASASEGEAIPLATPPIKAPPPVATQGWDAAGFGPCLVVGSLSTHPPEMGEGGMTSDTAKWPLPEIEEQNYAEASEAHSLSGVDMLWLEMMKDYDHAPRAVRAAAASGLPVFMGISARTDPLTGKLVLFGNGADCLELEREWFNNLRDILGPNLVGVNVMHTNFTAMGPTLKFVREECGWTGPLGAYPDHGVFKAPEWEFAELDNAEALAYVEGWIRDYNVQLVGGCCGLGPEYIQAVAKYVRDHNAVVRKRRAAAYASTSVA